MKRRYFTFLLNYRRVAELLLFNREKLIGFAKNIILIITIVSALVCTINLIFEYLLPLYLTHKYNLDVSRNDSAAIIGGADGPTSVFIARRIPRSFPITNILYLVTILGIACQFFIRRFKK